jgi:hypothetical protein
MKDKKVCTEDGLHVSKTLLRIVSPTGQAIDLYRKYISSTFNLNLSHTVLSNMPISLLEKFYREETPDRSPCYFNFFDPSDISKLDACLDFSIVILRVEEKSDRVSKVHDRRIMMDDDRPARFFVYLKRSDYCELYETFNDYDIRLSECSFIKWCTKSRANDCFINLVLASLGREATCVHSCGFCHDFLKFLCRPEGLKEFVFEPIILVSHISAEMRNRNEAMSPKNQMFAVLVNYAKNEQEIEAATVLAITGDREYIYQMRPAYVKSIKQIEKRKRTIKSEPLPFAQSVVVSNSPSSSKSKFNDDTYNFSCKNVASSRSCDCDPCKKAVNFQRNLPASGSQKLYRIKMSSYDHLRNLNLFTTEYEQLINEVCEMSLGAADAESMTRMIDDNLGNEDIFSVPSVSGIKIPRRVTALQVPIMLSWTDHTALEEGLKPFLHRWNPLDEEEMIREFVEELTTRKKKVVELKKQKLAPLFSFIKTFKEAHFKFFSDCKNGKEEDLHASDLCSSEEERSEGESGEEENFSQERKRRRKWSDEKEEGKTEKANRGGKLENAWFHSPIGLFEKHLLKLSESYLIFFFNGQSYDLPLLSSMLITYLRSTGHNRIVMSREGSRVKKISFSGIEILEAQKLLSPGFSLASFASVCGVTEAHKIEKGIFPFHLLTSLDFLKQPCLPTNAADWRNDLAPDKSPSQEDVDEVITFFKDSNMESIESYLIFYLFLDVELLQRSMVVLSRSLYQCLGVNFADCNKYTISSLSSYAAQTFLMRNKRPGNYTPSNCLIYSVSIP